MKDLYRQLCDDEPSIPLFSQAWWLDAVAGDDWDVVLVTKKDRVVGALPYLQRKKWGFRLLTQPKLTQNLGPWLRPTQKTYSKHLAYEKDILGKLADNLPMYDYYAQNWDCNQTNWLAFYWRGFTQTTRYTYRLEQLIDKDELWSRLQENIRREVRKARDRFDIRVRPANNLEEFLALNRMTFERQGLSKPYSDELVNRINHAAQERSACDCLVAVDPEGKVHAGAYIVRQGSTAYYLLGGGDPELRNSGATSLVLWEAICLQPEGVDIFDFEGSMIEPIERFFRGFGAKQSPYFHVAKSPSKLLSLAMFIRSQLK